MKYRTDKDFSLASRLVVFMAFVPPEHTETAFEALSIHSDYYVIYPARTPKVDSAGFYYGR